MQSVIRGVTFVVVVALVGVLALARGSYVNDNYHKWALLSEEAPFSPRDSAVGFVHDDHLYLSGGYNMDAKAEADLWQSRDGKSWTELSDKTPYDAYAPIAVLDGQIVAALYSAWSSSDGVNWSKSAETLPFGKVTVGSMVAFEDRLIFVDRNQVWESQTGAEWRALTTDAPFGERYGGQLVSSDGRLLYLAGTTSQEDSGEHYDYLRSHADVWASDDGVEWTLVTDSPGWEPRMWPAVTEHRGMLWLFGGFNNRVKGNFGDLWVSDDGAEWQRPASGKGPSARHAATAYSTDAGLIIVGGNEWPLLNDVWIYRDHPPLGVVDDILAGLEAIIAR